jgi:hypothetical protein
MIGGLLLSVGNHGTPAAFCCARFRLEKHFTGEAAMGTQDDGFDYDRYRRLLAEALDEPKRLALIELLIEERAKDQLELQRVAERNAMTVTTIARVLGTSKT